MSCQEFKIAVQAFALDKMNIDKLAKSIGSTAGIVGVCGMIDIDLDAVHFLRGLDGGWQILSAVIADESENLDSTDDTVFTIDNHAVRRSGTLNDGNEKLCGHVYKIQPRFRYCQPDTTSFAF